MEDPMCKKSNTATDEPNRDMLRSDMEDPKFEKSKTDSENTDPTRARPKSATVEPSREKLRRDKEAPKCKKSRTATEAANLEKLRIEQVDPK
jgi:hypothetical protein